MKKIITLVLIVAALLIVMLIIKELKSINFPSWTTKDRYDFVNLQVSEQNELKQIGSINIQEIYKIDNVRKNVLFSDDEIIGSYVSNINIGIDFVDAQDDWATKRGDSVFLKLPPIKVLNKNNWVIIKTDYPIRSGKWSNEELKQMEESANNHFLELAQRSFPKAQKELEDKFRDILSMKYKYIEIKFEK